MRCCESCSTSLNETNIYSTPLAHDSAVRSMCLSPDEEIYFTGSAEGDIKVFMLGASPG